MGQAAAKPAMSHLKVVLVGAHGCGKGGLCIRIEQGDTASLDGMLDGAVKPSHYDVKRRVKHGARLVQLDILRTDGHADYDKLRPLSYPLTDVVLLCFAIDKPESLERLRDKFVHEVRSHCSCEFVLVGLRADLRSTRPASELVTREAALEAAEEFSNERRLQNKSPFLNKKSVQRWAAPYLECSAKTGLGVDEVLAAAAAVRYPPLPIGIDPRRYEYV